MIEDYSKKRGLNLGWGFWLFIIAGSTLLFLFHFPFSVLHPPRIKVLCLANLKQIGLALKVYADDHEGLYPPYDGARGLEILRKNDYLAETRIYQCPNAVADNSIPLDSLEDDEISYVFVGGLSRNDNPDSPICWDKSGNHSNWGNVLFVDAHVKGYVGADWLEKATGKGQDHGR